MAGDEPGRVTYSHRWTRAPQLLRGTLPQSDETPVDLQMHDRRGQNHRTIKRISGSTELRAVASSSTFAGGADGRDLKQFDGIL